MRILIWLGMLGGLATASLAVGADEPSAATVARWIAELDHAEFRVREEATARLSEAGPTAVPALEQAARRGSLEVAVRAVEILRRLYGSGQEAEVDAAEAALEQLAESRNGSVADRANLALDTNYELRQKRAVAEIRRLGGGVKARDANGDFVPLNDDHPDAALVIIDRAWKGGDEGLKYIKRLTRLQALYRVKGANVTDAAVGGVQAAIPNLFINERGAACLGIKGNVIGGCVVEGVEPGSAADKAGLRPRDMIVQFDGRDVPTFETLVKLIGEHEPGDKVETTIIRDNQLKTMTVELGGWINTGK